MQTLRYFKANVFFRNYEILGSADRTLIYLTMYVSQCLRHLAKNVRPGCLCHRPSVPFVAL